MIDSIDTVLIDEAFEQPPARNGRAHPAAATMPLTQAFVSLCIFMAPHGLIFPAQIDDEAEDCADSCRSSGMHEKRLHQRGRATKAARASRKAGPF